MVQVRGTMAEEGREGGGAAGRCGESLPSVGSEDASLAAALPFLAVAAEDGTATLTTDGAAADAAEAPADAQAATGAVTLSLVACRHGALAASSRCCALRAHRTGEAVPT